MRTISYLKRIIRLLMSKKQAQFNRVLPINEYLNDRWAKARLLGWGEGSSCYDNVYVFGNVYVGAHTKVVV